MMFDAGGSAMPKLSRRTVSRKKFVWAAVLLFALAAVLATTLAVFFDEAVFVRKGTVYHVANASKLVALTFDDGPSPLWTPQILNELQNAGIKATFFMTGAHVKEYPDIARAVALAGHEIGNHSYDHHGLLYYTPEELRETVTKTERAIGTITGQTNRYFRPPKAWITDREKRQLHDMGYQVILWSLNSKDWVTFDDKFIIKYLLRHITPGDIILFHDSGGVFSTEGGDRHETVKTIPRLARELKARGYEFVTISELLARSASAKEQGMAPPITKER
jgi:peptidoglycan/xylan/chitin deacetylase (PgdA/CDA1 family)